MCNIYTTKKSNKDLDVFLKYQHWCDYMIFEKDIKYHPSYFDTVTNTYSWESWYSSGYATHRDRVPKLRIDYLCGKKSIVPIEEFDVDKWIKNRWRVEKYWMTPINN